MTKKIILQKRWVYTLYELDQKYVFSVAFCNQQTDYSVDYCIPIEEVSDEYLTQLASKITDNPEIYKNFEIKEV